jgi:hypothetical protein
LGSSAGQRAMELRETHRERVARNEVRVSPLWARPCRAYNVQIELDALTRASLGKTQQVIKRAEPDLLVCPLESFHVSIAWLLAVHASYPVPKDRLWECHAEEWTTELTRIAVQSAPFWITYEHVVATDSAVIALAEPTEPVNPIRRMIRELGHRAGAHVAFPPLPDQEGGQGSEYPIASEGLPAGRCGV